MSEPREQWRARLSSPAAGRGVVLGDGEEEDEEDGLFGGPARLTRQQVLDGVPGPDGVRIGFAVPEEAGRVTTLLKTAAGDLETGHLEVLAQGRCGAWLLDALPGADWASRS